MATKKRTGGKGKAPASPKKKGRKRAAPPPKTSKRTAKAVKGANAQPRRKDGEAKAKARGNRSSDSSHERESASSENATAPEQALVRQTGLLMPELVPTPEGLAEYVVAAQATLVELAHWFELAAFNDVFVHGKPNNRDINSIARVLRALVIAVDAKDHAQLDAWSGDAFRYTQKRHSKGASLGCFTTRPRTEAAEHLLGFVTRELNKLTDGRPDDADRIKTYNEIADCLLSVVRGDFDYMWEVCIDLPYMDISTATSAVRAAVFDVMDRGHDFEDADSAQDDDPRQLGKAVVRAVLVALHYPKAKDFFSYDPKRMQRAMKAKKALAGVAEPSALPNENNFSHDEFLRVPATALGCEKAGHGDDAGEKPSLD